MQKKNLFFLCLITFKTLNFCYNIEKSTQNFDSYYLKSNFLDFEFENKIQILEEPKIDYEDIEVVFDSFLSLDIFKFQIPKNLLLSSNNYMNLFFTISEPNKFYTKVLNVDEKKVIDLNLDFKNNKILNMNDENKFQEYFYSLSYYNTFKYFLFGTDFLFFYKDLIYYSNQFTFKPFFYFPLFKNLYFYNDFYLQFNKLQIENFEYYYYINNFKLDYILNYRFLLSIGLENIFFKFEENNLLYYKLNFIIKNFFIFDTLEFLAKYYNKDIFFIYDISKKFRKLNFFIKFGKNLFYEYLKNYFIDTNFLKLSSNIKFFYPMQNFFKFEIKYEEKNYQLSIAIEDEKYNKFPTYIYFNDEYILTFYIDDLHLNYIIYFFYIEFLNDNKIGLTGKYLLYYNKDILFNPKLKLGFFIENKIKNFYFITRLNYKDKILLNNNKFLEKSLLLEFENRYNIKDNISIILSYIVPLWGENYLYPEIIVKPYLSLGLNFNF